MPIVREASYSVRGWGRQSLVTAFVVAAAASLSACAGITLPPQAVEATASAASGSMPGLGGLTSDDLVAIGSALSTPHPRSGDLVWANADSGSQGRISSIRSVAGPGGDDCRAFATVVNAVDGVRALSGIACRDAAGGFAVEGLAPAVAGG
jgi:hypothetical protein